MLGYTFWDYFWSTVISFLIGAIFWSTIAVLVFLILALILGRTKTYGAITAVPTPRLQHLRLVRTGGDKPGDLEEIHDA
jgi:hypothetical protein